MTRKKILEQIIFKASGVGQAHNYNHKDFFNEMINLYNAEVDKSNDLILDELVYFTDKERDEFIDFTIIVNSQNLNGRESEEQLYKQGIEDCFDDLIEKINENFNNEIGSISNLDENQKFHISIVSKLINDLVEKQIITPNQKSEIKKFISTQIK